MVHTLLLLFGWPPLDPQGQAPEKHFFDHLVKIYWAFGRYFYGFASLPALSFRGSVTAVVVYNVEEKHIATVCRSSYNIHNWEVLILKGYPQLKF